MSLQTKNPTVVIRWRTDSHKMFFSNYRLYICALYAAQTFLKIMESMKYGFLIFTNSAEGS